MKSWGVVVFSVAVLTACSSALAADEGRFDAQVFRPLAAPRDLVMVPKSEVIGHLSPVAGLYWDVALDPLALVLGGTVTSFPDSAAQVPAEVLLGLRWQTRQGITVTVGGSFGAACGFGAPAIRLFNSITWQPKSSAEQQEINRVLERDSVDPDRDGVLEPADKCPEAAGKPQNDGCPDQDRDEDGVIDREDQCPDLAAQSEGVKGCPLARVEVEGDTIATIEPITFELDSAELSDRTKNILEAVRRVMRDTPAIHEVEVGVHTDVREGEEEGGVDIAHKRALRIMRWLINSGIERERLSGVGYGYWQPDVDDSDCLGETLSPECKAATQANRRVIFQIKRWGPPASWPILGGDGPASELPIKRLGEVAQTPKLKDCRPTAKGTEAPIPCVLPMKSGKLDQNRVLKNSKDAEGRLPSGSAHLLPSGGVLQKEENGPAVQTPMSTSAERDLAAQPETP